MAFNKTFLVRILVLIVMVFRREKDPSCNCFTEALPLQEKSCSFPLDLALNSVDDMYIGCEDEMDEEVPKWLDIEKKGNFKEAWRVAEQYYNNTWATTTSVLKKEQIMAVHAYTLDKPKLYDEFNKAVRTQKSEYTTKFQYHAFNFYLTMALRSLKPNAAKCVTTYRRTKCRFKTGINREVRFGGFTSSSLGSYASPQFGVKSCFEIITCFGAGISQFSMYELENEVLIPPYEVFKVTDIQKRSGANSLPCEVVYKLKSTSKTRSYLNCALADKTTNNFYKRDINYLLVCLTILNFVFTFLF